MMKKLYDELKMESVNAWDIIDVSDRQKMVDFCNGYMNFLSVAKTERKACSKAIELAKSSGFVSIKEKKELRVGDKIYVENRGKGVLLAVIGEESLSNGLNLVGAHLDSPRLDLKPNPLYEEDHFAYFKTHYYGSIKKFQWLTIPLALHGILIKKDGCVEEICIGEDQDDPIFCITDLLPHLATDQANKKLSDAFTGEGLNILFGSEKLGDKEIKEKVKFNILKLLNEKYGIVEKDFISSELEVVPAWRARDLGFDKSMIAGYGHDDKVCSYAALRAVLEVEVPKRTSVTLLVDKEEIGSMGNTGMKARFFENVIAELCFMLGHECNADLILRRCLANSRCLSADVGCAFDPNYAEVTEKRNTAFINGGIMISKYTGSRGKYSTSDANVEFMSKILTLFDQHDVVWQTGELGKVDMGGGGTIAQYVANLGADVLDCGPPVLSMHSPLEVVGKLDVYMSYKGYKAFFVS